MPSEIESRLDNALPALIERYNQVEILGKIENLLWLIAALLAVIAFLLYYRMRREASAKSQNSRGWQKNVERAYDKEDYKTALNILDTTHLLYPGSAWVPYWQGRCYFQMQEWEKAASTFEDLVRREPIFRKSIRDYMAFIELNELVDGVDGYLDKDD